MIWFNCLEQFIVKHYDVMFTHVMNVILASREEMPDVKPWLLLVELLGQLCLLIKLLTRISNFVYFIRLAGKMN